MYFFDGRPGAFERMTTQKPEYHCRNGKSGKDSPNKKTILSKPVEGSKESKKGEKSDE